MKLLEVLPTYPGEEFDGSAVYERKLNAALRARGVEIEVLTTRAQKLVHEEQFLIRWPDELPRHGRSPTRRSRAGCTDPGQVRLL